MQRRTRIRFSNPTWMAFSLVFALSACSTMPPAAWAMALRPDFSTPESTGESFFAAWSAKEPLTEYRCLSERLKRQIGVEFGGGTGATLDAYLLFRPDLEQKIGWAGRHSYKLQAMGSELLDDGGVLVWWGRSDTVYLGLKMVHQDYFEFTEAGGKMRQSGGFLDRELEDYFEFTGKEFSLILEDSSIRTVRTMASVGKFEIGTEWKILGMVQAQTKESAQ